MKLLHYIFVEHKLMLSVM